MESQKLTNLLDNTLNQPSKLRRRNQVEINDDTHETYNTNSQIRFKTSMLNSTLCDYSDTYILVKGTISVAAGAAVGGNNEKKVIFKNCASFTDCIREINNAEIDNAKEIDVVMSMYTLKEYSDNYSKTSGRFWQYYRDNNNNSVSFIIKNNR